MQTSLSFPFVFSKGHRISLKSLKHTQGREDMLANLFKNVHVWCFQLISRCPQIPTHLQQLPFSAQTITSIWRLLQDLISTNKYEFYIKAKPHFACFVFFKTIIKLQLFTFLLHLTSYQLGFAKEHKFKLMLLEQFLSFSERWVTPQSMSVPAYNIHGRRWGWRPASIDVNIMPSVSNSSISLSCYSFVSIFSFCFAFGELRITTSVWPLIFFSFLLLSRDVARILIEPGHI